jgi:signal transduction histidine kinase
LSIITLLSGNLDTLYERLDEDKRQQMIRDIREHAKVLNDLISSVLEISRIDSRRISTRSEHLNLAHVAREEVEQQMPLAQKKEQRLSTRGAERLMVWANDGQLRQVIRNLLNNAIKYTPPEGEICCECQVWQPAAENTDAPPNGSERWSLLGSTPGAVWPGSEGLPPGRWAALRVIDSGVGINPEELPHIFERFYRVQSQGKIPGTGLGLSIAQELINLQDGHIAIASTPGQGSIVAIYLPLVEDTE